MFLNVKYWCCFDIAVKWTVKIICLEYADNSVCVMSNRERVSSQKDLEIPYLFNNAHIEPDLYKRIDGLRKML